MAIIMRKCMNRTKPSQAAGRWGWSGHLFCNYYFFVSGPLRACRGRPPVFRFLIRESSQTLYTLVLQSLLFSIDATFEVREVTQSPSQWWTAAEGGDYREPKARSTDASHARTPRSHPSQVSWQQRPEDFPGPTQGRITWLLRHRSARTGLRILSLPEGVEVSSGLPEEGSSTAYANCIAVVIIGAVVGIDDVVLSFDEGKPTTPASRWCGDIHVFVDSALPHGADLKANRRAIFRGVRLRIRIEGVLNREDPPGEDCGKLSQLVGRRTGLRTLTRVDLARVPEEPYEVNYEREAHCGYECDREPHPLTICDHFPHDLFTCSRSFVAELACIPFGGPWYFSGSCILWPYARAVVAALFCNFGFFLEVNSAHPG